MRRGKSQDWQDLPKRDQKAIREGMDALYGRSATDDEAYQEAQRDKSRHAREVSAPVKRDFVVNREPFPGAPRFACPECGTVDRRQHAEGCKLGAMAEMGHGKR